jgi:hypothetical protein
MNRPLAQQRIWKAMEGFWILRSCLLATTEKNAEVKILPHYIKEMHAESLESMTDWKIMGITCMHSRALEKCPERFGVFCLLTGLQLGGVLSWHANTLLFVFRKEMPLFAPWGFCPHAQDL